MVNAFWLDREADRAVEYLVDKHVLSSVFECSMVLTTAVQLNGYPESDDLYFTHPDHPLTVWTADTLANWNRLREYVRLAHEEWRYRYDHPPEKEHGSWATVASLDDETVAALDWPTDAATDPPQVTGEWRAADYVDAYRLYYANEKRNLFEWTGRDRPPWIEVYTVPDEADSHPFE